MSRLMNSAIGMNIGLIVGIASGAVLLVLVLVYAAYKYLSQEEGSYRLDCTEKYGYEGRCGAADKMATTAVSTAKTSYGAALSDTVNASTTAVRSKKKQIKEWYV